MTEVDANDDGIYVRGAAYTLWLAAGSPYALLADRQGRPWAHLFLPASLHTRQGPDETVRLHAAAVDRGAGGCSLRLRADSSVWRAKEIVLCCEPDEVRLETSVEGEGALTDVHLLGGYHTGARRHGSGYFHSGAEFAAVCNPEPWGSERRVVHATESTVLDVLGGTVPGREHWLFTPPPLCLALSRSPANGGIPAGPWATLGVCAAPGQHHFTAVHYDAVEAAFSLRLTYEGQTRVSGRFDAPAVQFRFDAPDPYAGLRAHADSLRRRGLAPQVSRRAAAAWWSRPLFCGWGAQCVRAGRDGGEPADYATQRDYDSFLSALADNGLHPGTVVVDDKWQADYGTCRADEDKWPDLRGWIDRRHAQGQRVLLWWKAWDPEGLAAEHCVRNSAGVVHAADPSHPGYEATLRAAVRHMLGAGGYDADGFKVDFTAWTPSGSALRRHGREWGIELLHRLLRILYSEAKRTKPDALVITHTPHPYFADVTDMIRLNDVNTRAPVLPQMRHRAKVARAACPGVLIDTDNWPMPDPETFRDYVHAQPELGVPALYYATDLDRYPPWTPPRKHVDWDGYRQRLVADGVVVPQPRSSHEPMTAEDYAAVRHSWARATGASDDA